MRLTYSISLAVLFALTSIFSCKPAVKMEPGVDAFGEDFKVENVTDFSTVMSVLENSEEVNAVMKVKVDKVCKVKGCWMNVSPVDDTAGEMFVKFKDYGFFVPVDLVDDGTKEIYMKGKAFKEITTVDELRHYAEDEGKSAEEIAKITEPEVQVKFMAIGVKLI